jgi:diguanylate cyclase (GGDEF)-like protein
MRVLIIDDDEVDYHQIKRTLARAFPNDRPDISWISNPSEGNILQEIDEHDICLIDQNMGAVSGVDIIQKSSENGSFTPIILFTGEDNKAVDEKAAEYGAADYLLKKDLTPSLLNRSIRYALVQSEHTRKLAEFAYMDGLTGLANRSKFDHALQLAIDTTERAQTYLALFIIDLDDFKVVNDTYGHPAGDAVLIEVASRISNMVRKTDIVARLGGDEFGVVLNGYTNKNDIHLLTEKMLSLFTEPVCLNIQKFHVRCSIGIAILEPNEKDRDPASLSRAADGALYRAKHKGKNSYEFFNTKIGESLKSIADLETDLACCVEREELELYFQPKVSASKHLICGVEALLRWHRKNGDPIGPAEFIPIAERSLSILEIGKWVIEEACRIQRKLIDDGADVITISVNVSPLQIQSDNFVEHILETLQRYNIEPHLLEFEITETVLLKQYNHIIDRITTLANIGCTWAIDDFGIGYSSFSMLQKLPISKIKLDKSFVQEIETSNYNRKICSIVSLLAHEINLTLVAEGVETLGQLNMLTLLEKDELQGYYFSKPISTEAYQTLIKTEKSKMIKYAVNA